MHQKNFIYSKVCAIFIPFVNLKTKKSTIKLLVMIIYDMTIQDDINVVK